MKKTNIFRNVFMLFGLMLLSLVGFSKQHVTMSLENITTTSTTIEYDLFIVNDGTTTLRLCGASYGLTYNSSILNGATPSENAYSFIPGTRSQELAGLSDYSVSNIVTEKYNHLRMTMSPVKAEMAPVLTPNVAYKIGRFKFTNSVPWTKNSNPALSFCALKVVGLTTTQVIAYVDGNRTSSGMTTALNTVKTNLINSPILNVDNSVLASNPKANTTANSAVESAQQVDNAKINISSTKINIYPNPTQDIVNVELNATSVVNAKVKVLDMRGRIVKQVQARVESGVSTIKVSLNDVPAAMYTVQVYENSKLTYVGKVNKKN